MLSIVQMAARKSDANLKEFNKKAPKRALCFQNQDQRAHKACTPNITWELLHARRVRFRDLETHRTSIQLHNLSVVELWFNIPSRAGQGFDPGPFRW
jgi:hypothetical protein